MQSPGEPIGEPQEHSITSPIRMPETSWEQLSSSPDK